MPGTVTTNMFREIVLQVVPNIIPLSQNLSDPLGVRKHAATRKKLHVCALG